jgi:biotin carboxyl carrier protein
LEQKPAQSTLGPKPSQSTPIAANAAKAQDERKPLLERELPLEREKPKQKSLVELVTAPQPERPKQVAAVPQTKQAESVKQTEPAKPAVTVTRPKQAEPQPRPAELTKAAATKPQPKQVEPAKQTVVERPRQAEQPKQVERPKPAEPVEQTEAKPQLEQAEQTEQTEQKQQSFSANFSPAGSQSKPAKHTRKRLWETPLFYALTGAALLIVITFALLVAFDPFKGPASVTEPVVRGTFTDSISVNGTLQPRSQETVTTSQTGSISNIWVSEGDMVSEGDALFEVETSRGHEDITAPISGEVVQLDLVTGKSYAEQNMVIIADLASMEVVLDVNEVDISKIAIGQTAQLSFDAVKGLSLTATVTHIAKLPNVGAAAAGLASGGTVVTYPVKLALDAEDPALRPGMSVSAHITVSEIPDVLLVNALAIQELDNSTVVYVQEPRGGIAAVDVNIIASSPTQAAVEGDLSEGENVFIDTYESEQEDYGDLFTVRRNFNG